MSYIVYHIKSTVSFKVFNKESAAKRSATCANRNAGSVQYAYASEEHYRTNVVGKTTVKNLMTSKDVEIDSNTPWFMRPDSESYWAN